MSVTIVMPRTVSPSPVTALALGRVALASLVGTTMAPSIAQRLVIEGGLAWVGYYLSATAAVSFLSVLTIRETTGKNLSSDDLEIGDDVE